MIKGIGAIYTVFSGDATYNCVAQKKTKQIAEFLIGDEVEFLEENGTYFITKILARRNFLVRPKVANIDQLVIIIAKLPQPDLMLVDKLIIYADNMDIDTLLVVNKSDLINEAFVTDIKNQYASVVDDIIVISAKHHLKLDELKEHLQNKLSVFVGQSAVGKSTILNALSAKLDLEVGELSKKTDRGKHTTRSAEVFELDNNTLIVDTPGFSLLDLFEVEPKKLHEYYGEFLEFSNDCKYRACNHVQMLLGECAVKRAVATGKLNKDRYDRYVAHYNDIKKRWESRYD
ncbi:MAG: ribosome small subunit-dependent GTPase A [Clostridia bacterium]|nr:ribosome small subunit-dependent GTPase A [Clostridia bacterium]